MLRHTASAVVAGLAAPAILIRAADSSTSKHGLIAGEPTAASVGQEILARGGNAVDAAVAAALAACVVSPNNCGIAGYGGHMTLALNGGRTIRSIDFNTAAPQAARPDMFAVDEKGIVRDRANEFGWLASSVPGTLAGLQLAIDRFAKKSLRELAAPAIKLARDGFPVGRSFGAALRAMAARLHKDPGSANLYFRNGEPFKTGETFRNPELADLLDALAKDNSVDPFYRGAIARKITGHFQKNGGLLTARDMSDYHAREVQPLRLDWEALSIFTAPLTAGGTTVLQALSILKALKWPGQSSLEAVHAQVEALRLAWRDRLTLLGDPEHTHVPVQRLLSDDYARELAKMIQSAVKQKQALLVDIGAREQNGTIHLSCADREGNLVALTLTQGNSFGSCVTIGSLGLTFGHGMSRFEPRPGHPNSAEPRKQPLHNMCPTVVLRHGKPGLALGGSGGRRIVNGVFDVLARCVTGATLSQAIAAPRLNTFGRSELELSRDWPQPQAQYLKTAGFKVTTGAAAHITGVSFDSRTGQVSQAAR